MTSGIELAVSEAVRKHAEALEAACERMLTDTRGWGVLEHDYGMRWSIELSPLVPFGSIHTHKVAEGGACRGCENEMYLRGSDQ